MNTCENQVFYSIVGSSLRETTIDRKNMGVSSYKDYPLEEVTPEKLMEYRLSKKPGFVLKDHDKLYYAPFFRKVHLVGTGIGVHLCNICSNVCNHCRKVDDWTVQFHCRMGRKFPTAVKLSGRIEKYDFIPYAAETFNCETDTYLVLECANHR